jgi:hypothetical protein
MLETLSWIAAIIAVPVAVIGWFMSGGRRTNKSVASKSGIAISGDMHVGDAGIVAGHCSPLNVRLTVSKDTQHVELYERRYAIFQAVGEALNEALCDKMISAETFQSFCKAVSDSRFLLGDHELVAYLNEIRMRADKFQAITISMEALPPGGEKARASAAAGKQRLWLIDQIDGLSEKFESVLRYSPSTFLVRKPSRGRADAILVQESGFSCRTPI